MPPKMAVSKRFVGARKLQTIGFGRHGGGTGMTLEVAPPHWQTNHEIIFERIYWVEHRGISSLYAAEDLTDVFPDNSCEPVGHTASLTAKL
jgi:hypothetical protein